jgi:uncharacterized hydantoinase/oxoprolinase family protein
MTLEELLCSLRERLSQSWDQNNQEDLAVLMTTFGVLREQLYGSKNPSILEIVETLEEATRRAIMRFKSKGEIPSIEAIHNAFVGPN